jgi:hypothetical protein
MTWCNVIKTKKDFTLAISMVLQSKITVKPHLKLLWGAEDWINWENS